MKTLKNKELFAEILRRDPFPLHKIQNKFVDIFRVHQNEEEN